MDRMLILKPHQVTQNSLDCRVDVRGLGVDGDGPDIMDPSQMELVGNALGR